MTQKRAPKQAAVEVWREQLGSLYSLAGCVAGRAARGQVAMETQRTERAEEGERENGDKLNT